VESKELKRVALRQSQIIMRRNPWKQDNYCRGLRFCMRRDLRNGVERVVVKF